MHHFRCAIVGATGIVGQRLCLLLSNHALFSLDLLLASPRSAGKTYEEALAARPRLPLSFPKSLLQMRVLDASFPEMIAGKVDLVFFASSLPKDEERALEERYAKCELPVISLSSACRDLPDVPMIVPELNPEHLAVLPAQKKRLGTRRGFVVTKCNCSLQSFVPLLTPLLPLGLETVDVCTLQAVSGAGKTLDAFPEIEENVLPFIQGEEEKCEIEPLKIWGKVQDGQILPLQDPPKIKAQCFRVPVMEGHLASVFARFSKPVSREEILSRWQTFSPPPQVRALPSAPSPFLCYREENDRPQPRLDRLTQNGMAIVAGRLRCEQNLCRFVALSHNTLRGAAGGAVLLAELLAAQGFLG